MVSAWPVEGGAAGAGPAGLSLPLPGGAGEGAPPAGTVGALVPVGVSAVPLVMGVGKGTVLLPGGAEGLVLLFVALPLQKSSRMTWVAGSCVSEVVVGDER